MIVFLDEKAPPSPVPAGCQFAQFIPGRHRACAGPAHTAGLSNTGQAGRGKRVKKLGKNVFHEVAKEPVRPSSRIPVHCWLDIDTASVAGSWQAASARWADNSPAGRPHNDTEPTAEHETPPPTFGKGRNLPDRKHIAHRPLPPPFTWPTGACQHSDQANAQLLPLARLPRTQTAARWPPWYPTSCLPGLATYLPPPQSRGPRPANSASPDHDVVAPPPSLQTQLCRMQDPNGCPSHSSSR